MNKPTDQELDTSVANMLRFGVSLAALIVFVGGVLLLRSGWAVIPNYSQFQPGRPSLRTVSGILVGASRFEPKSIIQFGLLVLIGTPVARVVLCVIGFSRQGKPIYVAVSLIVLAVLMYSFMSSGLWIPAQPQ
jgi:uncharacterized membrane protein